MSVAELQVIQPGELAAATPLTPMVMLGQAVASGANIEVLGRLMDLQERWECGRARNAFDAASAAVPA